MNTSSQEVSTIAVSQPVAETSTPEQDQSPPKNKHFLENIPESRMSVYIILFLIVAPPIGLILMWLWAKWPRVIKIIITSVMVILPVLGLLISWILASSLS